MRILALDLATKTGWAYGDSSWAKPRMGVERLPSTGEDIGWFLDEAIKWLTEMIPGHPAIEHRPDLVVFECPIMRGLGNTNIVTERKLYSLAAIVEWVCRRSGVECAEEHLQSIKKFWTGNGRAEKREMRIAAARIWPDTIAATDDDACDAAALWALAVHKRDASQRQRFALMGFAAEPKAEQPSEPKPSRRKRRKALKPGKPGTLIHPDDIPPPRVVSAAVKRAEQRKVET